MTERVLLQGEAGQGTQRVLQQPTRSHGRLLPGSGNQHSPAHIPYRFLECLLSISLQAPSWARGMCRVLPLRCASGHVPVVGAQSVMDFPPAWGEVCVRLQALVTPEVVCAERA